MTHSWLEITIPDVNSAQLAVEIEQNAAERTKPTLSDNADTPEALVLALRQQIIGRDGGVPLSQLELRDCDIVPRTYHIGWQTPLLGPIFARVRQIINGEIRRFLWPSLEQQSALNRQMVRLIHQLQAENQQLRQEIEALSQNRDSTDGV